MSGHYKLDPRDKHTTKNNNRAQADHRRGLTTFSGRFKKHSIPIAVLCTCRSANNSALKSQGGQAALSEPTELHIAQRPAT